MFLFCGILFVFIGLALIFFPEEIYSLWESWKSSSYSEPSDKYILSARIGGAVYLLVGIAAFVMFFVM